MNLKNGSGIKDTGLMLILLSVVMLLYLWSMPRTVVLEDDAYFILASYYNGIAHPPGYPLFTLLGHLFTKIDVGSIASRVHALSALFGAISCVILFLIILQIVRNRLIAFAGSVLLATSSIFWSQAIIAEVYTLNCMLFLCLLFLSICISRTKQQLKPVYYFVIGLIIGLGISNHWPLFILAMPAVFILVINRLVNDRYAPVMLLPGVVVGLLPYLWMIYRSQMSPEISFYGPIKDWSGFWFYFSREPYASIDQSVSAGLIDKLAFTQFHIRELMSQFGPFGWLFLIVGFIYQWQIKDKQIPVALCLAYAGNSVLLIILLGFEYDVFHQALFRVYPLTAYAIATIWICFGIDFASQYLSSKYRQAAISGKAVALISIVITTSAAMVNAADNYRANDTWAEEYARTLLAPLEQNAILFANGDTDLGPIAYVNRILKVREDVELYNIKSVLLPTRLYEPIRVDRLDLSETVDTFIHSTSRPVYYTNELPHQYGVENTGLVKRVITDKQSNYRTNTLISEYDDYMNFITRNPPQHDLWEQLHYRLLQTIYCRFLLESGREQSANIEADGLANRVCDTFQGLIERIEFERGKKTPDWLTIRKYIDEAMARQSQSVVKTELARLFFYDGEYHRHTGDLDKAIRSLNQSLKIKSNGPAIDSLTIINELIKKT